jgi:selenoprotein W-related protein
MAQEILASFKDEVAELTLRPGSGGIFLVSINGRQVFSNKTAGRFPETREVRDAIRESLGLGPSPSHRKST